MVCARRKAGPGRFFGTDFGAAGRGGFDRLLVAVFFGVLVCVSAKGGSAAGVWRSVAFNGKGAGASESHVGANSNAR